MTHIALPTAWIILSVLCTGWLSWTFIKLRRQPKPAPSVSRDMDIGELDALMLIFAFVFLTCGLLFLRYATPAAGVSFLMSGLTCGFHDPRIRSLKGDKLMMAIVAISGVFCGVGTWVLFATFSLIPAIIGLVVAFAFGQCLGMVARTLSN